MDGWMDGWPLICVFTCRQPSQPSRATPPSHPTSQPPHPTPRRKKKWSGPLQYEDRSGQLMMLPTDMALVWDRKFKPHVDRYAADEDAFFADFAAAFSKLLALGVPGQSP